MPDLLLLDEPLAGLGNILLVPNNSIMVLYLQYQYVEMKPSLPSLFELGDVGFLGVHC